MYLDYPHNVSIEYLVVAKVPTTPYCLLPDPILHYYGPQAFGFATLVSEAL